MPTQTECTPSPRLEFESQPRTSRWSKPANAWKIAQALTPRARKQHTNANMGDNTVQFFTPLSGVPMTATTEPLFSHGSYNGRGSAHINPFIEQ